MENVKVLLWLDDLRDPFSDDWRKDYAPEYLPNSGVETHTVWVKNFRDFKNWISVNGLPDTIGFDHDLGQDIAIEKVKRGISKRQARKEKKTEFSGYDCAKWLVEYCMDRDLEIPEYFVQSANPVGKENIISLLENFKKHQRR